MTQPEQKVAEFVELTAPQEKLLLVCRWTEKNYEDGRTVSVHLASDEEVEELDRLLWTFRQNAFIPHVILPGADEPVIEPVVLATDGESLPQSDVLFIASCMAPGEWFRNFGHIYDFAEVYDEEHRRTSRERYTKCKEAGYRMRYIKAPHGQRV